MMRTLLPGAAALLSVAAIDIFSSVDTGLVEAPAHAIVGRPLTPVSYAGVARRTTRRVAYGTAAVVATAPPPQQTTVVVQQPAPAPAPPPK
jgi:hypothetical protein